MSAIKILNRKTLSDKATKLEEVNYSYIDKAGNEQSAKREVYYRGACAAILLYDPQRHTVILTAQLRLPVSLNEDLTGNLLEACAGMVDKGELPEQCIVREVEEETGYRISEVQKIGEGYTSPACLTEYMHLFFGKYSPEMKISPGGGKKEEGEDIRVLEISAAEARHRLFSGQIRDLKTILLLQRAMISEII